MFSSDPEKCSDSSAGATRQGCAYYRIGSWKLAPPGKVNYRELAIAGTAPAGTCVGAPINQADTRRIRERKDPSGKATQSGRVIVWVPQRAPREGPAKSGRLW